MSATLTNRPPATVIPPPSANASLARARPSRLPSYMRVPILVVLSLSLNTLMWETASKFLRPELGAVSLVPGDESEWSVYSPAARLAGRVAMVWGVWAAGYDFYDVAALTVLTQAPHAFLLSTYYSISTITIAVLVNIEVFSLTIPIYLLRAVSPSHSAHAPLRNRYLLQSIQVQTSSALLAMGVYVALLWGLLRSDTLNLWIVRYFEVPSLETAHAETPLSLLGKLLTVGIAAKEFLLNPAIAAQSPSGTASPTPAEKDAAFDPATATLPQTLARNFWAFDRRTRTLIRQTGVLSVFVFGTTVQRCLTLRGTEVYGAVGYAGAWVVVNAVIAAWFVWVGDTAVDYEPL